MPAPPRRPGLGGDVCSPFPLGAQRLKPVAFTPQRVFLFSITVYIQYSALVPDTMCFCDHVDGVRA